MFLVERKLSDDHIECLQFGICDYAPRQVEEVPFLIINIINLKYLLGKLFDSRSTIRNK